MTQRSKYMKLTRRLPRRVDTMPRANYLVGLARAYVRGIEQARHERGLAEDEARQAGYAEGFEAGIEKAREWVATSGGAA